MSNIPKVRAGIGFVQNIAGMIPVYGPAISAGLGVVDKGLDVAQQRQQAVNDQVDPSANAFTQHDVTFGAAAEQQTVNHKLDRPPNGYNVVSQNADIRVFQVSADARTLVLEATGAGSIKLRVF